MSYSLEDVTSTVLGLLGADALSHTVSLGELTVTVPRPAIATILTRLRDDPTTHFEQLMELCGADYPDRAERFDVIYCLLSVKHNARVRLKITTDEKTAVPSACAVYPSANWSEREVFDLYGISFDGHPDLRRILTDYGFEGHPLRKDFPLSGFVECRYDDVEKRVVQQPVSLPQAYRDFDFLSPWEGVAKVLDRPAPPAAPQGEKAP